MPIPPPPAFAAIMGVLEDLSCVAFRREMSAEGEITYPWLSDNFALLFGLAPEQATLTRQGTFNAVHWADRQSHVDAIRNSAADGERCLEGFRAIGADGRTRWFHGSSEPRPLPGGGTAWDGIWLDITAWMQAEQRHLTVMDHAEDCILSLDEGMGVEWANNAARRLFGHEPDALLGLPLSALVDDAGPGPETREVAARRADGTILPFEMTVSEVRADGRLSFLVIGRDITERRRLQLALQEGHKLEALGRLAGGVAHELNNMLGPILMAAEMIERNAALDERNRERLGRIIDAAKHGRDIVRNVLAYSRKDEPAAPPQAVAIAPLFEQFVSLASSILPPSIRVEWSCTAGDAMVACVPTQLHQILLNLANNARDAMAGAGTLTLSLARGSGGDVEIAVGDTGSGMAPETIQRIFDPFFTTKPVGQGTGLGLSVVQGLVKGMNGTIRVESTPGEGTTVRVRLPGAEG